MSLHAYFKRTLAYVAKPRVKSTRHGCLLVLYFINGWISKSRSWHQLCFHSLPCSPCKQPPRFQRSSLCYSIPFKAQNWTFYEGVTLNEKASHVAGWEEHKWAPSGEPGARRWELYPPASIPPAVVQCGTAVCPWPSCPWFLLVLLFSATRGKKPLAFCILVWALQVPCWAELSWADLRNLNLGESEGNVAALAIVCAITVNYKISVWFFSPLSSTRGYSFMSVML